MFNSKLNAEEKIESGTVGSIGNIIHLMGFLAGYPFLRDFSVLSKFLHLLGFMRFVVLLWTNKNRENATQLHCFFYLQDKHHQKILGLYSKEI